MSLKTNILFLSVVTRGTCTAAYVNQAGGSADDIEVVQIVVGAGAKHRPVARGSHYAMTPSHDTAGVGGYTQVAIIDLDTQVKQKNAVQITIYYLVQINVYPLIYLPLPYVVQGQCVYVRTVKH